MQGLRVRRSLRRGGLAGGIGALALVAAYFAAQASGVVGTASLLGKTTVNVTVGSPTEASVKVSKTSGLSSGPFDFVVTNKGAVKHTFLVCSKTVSTLANSCSGKSVTVSPGKTGTVHFVRLGKGKYEFIATAPNQAGSKGWVGVRVTVPTALVKIPAASTGNTGGGKGTTTTTANSPGAPLTFPPGNASNGLAVWNAATCGSCHTMKAAGGTGTIGPDLDDLQPSITDVENQVFSGGGEMPGYGSVLTKQQIADVATYVNASTK